MGKPSPLQEALTLVRKALPTASGVWLQSLLENHHLWLLQGIHHLPAFLRSTRRQICALSAIRRLRRIVCGLGHTSGGTRAAYSVSRAVRLLLCRCRRTQTRPGQTIRTRTGRETEKGGVFFETIHSASAACKRGILRVRDGFGEGHYCFWTRAERDLLCGPRTQRLSRWLPECIEAGAVRFLTERRLEEVVHTVEEARSSSRVTWSVTKLQLLIRRSHAHLVDFFSNSRSTCVTRCPVESPMSPSNGQDPYRNSGDIHRLKSVHLDRKLSATAHIPKRSTIVESPTGKTAQTSDMQAQQRSQQPTSTPRPTLIQGTTSQSQQATIQQPRSIGRSPGQQQIQTSPIPSQGPLPQFLQQQGQSSPQRPTRPILSPERRLTRKVSNLHTPGGTAKSRSLKTPPLILHPSRTTTILRICHPERRRWDHVG
jgi:hypothetical protein